MSAPPLASGAAWMFARLAIRKARGFLGGMRLGHDNTH